MATKKNAKSECVRVIIRCRPMSSKERNAGQQCVVEMVAAKGEVLVRRAEGDIPKVFTFDCVYDYKSQQEQIFTESAYPIIENILEGYNGTIFAYGQTGTGKTHTMTGEIDNNELMGIMPRSFQTIFNQIETFSARQYLVRISFLEIYNEEIQDLLAKNSQEKLELKEKPDSGVYVKDLSTFVVKTPKEMMKLLQEGDHRRHFGETNMNAKSSRSHSIFTITIEN